MTAVNFVLVPYKGTSPAISDLVGGQVDFMFNSMPAVLPLAKTGKLRALATAGRKRSAATPDLPTIAETIPGYGCINWYALLAPRGVPSGIVGKLNAEVVKLFAEPQVAQRFADQGSEPQTGTPAELAAYMRSVIVMPSRVPFRLRTATVYPLSAPVTIGCALEPSIARHPCPAAPCRDSQASPSRARCRQRSDRCPPSPETLSG